MGRRKKKDEPKKDPYAPSEAHLEMVERNREYADKLRANINQWIAHRDRFWLGKSSTPIEAPVQTDFVENELEFEAPVHHCHAFGCSTQCAPKYLMCQKHWRMVSPELQRAVWEHYRPGQEEDKEPSPEWHAAADAAILHVKQLEGEGGLVTRTDQALARCRERLHRAIPLHIRQEAERLAAEYNARFPMNAKGTRDNMPPMTKHPPVYISERRETPF